jgi:hypothetical protein
MKPRLAFFVGDPGFDRGVTVLGGLPVPVATCRPWHRVEIKLD